MAWDEPGAHESARRPQLVLALAATRGVLTCFLSDGRSRFDHGLAPWPPARGGSALPPDLLARIADAREDVLRLQIEASVDDWPWEAEVAAARDGLPVARFLVKGPAALEAAPAGPSLTPGTLGGGDADVDPQWLHGPAAAAVAQAWQAQTRGCPSLAIADHVAAERADAFQRLLRSAWGPEPWLSAAALTAAQGCGLARSDWRLYGDLRFTPAGATAEPQWRLVTSVSIDLVKSTDVMRSMGTERYAESHHAFYSLCRGTVEAHGGRLDDPQGDDGMVAYFGLRPGQGDATAQAVRVAWSLLTEVAALSLSIRVGVATGRLALDSQGQQYGQDISLAARLQEQAATNGMLISERTHGLLGPGVVREPLPAQLVLKGFEQPQQAYRVLGLPVPHLASRRPARTSRFVGRRHEHAELRAAWGAVQRSGRGQYHCLVGEPGIGKSRLLREFELSLAGDDASRLLIRLSGQAETQSSAFTALVQAVQTPGLRSLSVPLQRAAVHAEGPRSVLAHQDRERLLDELVAALDELAGHGPICCLVDDAQWLDPSTIEWVERLRLHAASLPLLLVVSLRDDPRSLGRGLHAVGAVRLCGLGADEADELITALAAGTELTAEVRRTIAARAAGVPLFLEETVHLVAQREVDTAAALLGVPDTLEELLLSRLDALGPARPLALLASVLGAEFSAHLWTAVQAEPDEWIVRARSGGASQRLLDSELLQTHALGDLHYRFRHALLRDAAYESLWVRDRRRLHAIVARVLERMSRPVSGHLELRAHHLAAAGDLEAAFKAWGLAARQAAAVAADRESLALAQRALNLVPELQDCDAVREQALQLHLLQAARYIALDGYGAATVESAYLRATALCSDTEDAAVRTRVDLGLEACYAMRGDLDRARALAEAAVRRTPWDGNPRLALQARWAWVNVVFHQGELLPALEMAEQCLARYHTGLHHPGAVQDPAVMCLCYSAWGLFEQGRADEAQGRIDSVLTLARELDHPFSLAVAHGFAASIALFCGRHQAGLAHAEEAVERCRAGAFQAWLAHALVVRGRLRAALGDARAGLAEMEQGLQQWNRTGARITSATYLAFQADVLLGLGEAAEALRRLAQAHEIAARCGERYHAAELLRLEGLARWRLQAGTGDAAAAQALLQQALDTARAQGKGGFALRNAHALADTWALQGRTAEAVALLGAALHAVPGQRDTADAAAARTALRSWSGSDFNGLAGDAHAKV